MFHVMNNDNKNKNKNSNNNEKNENKILIDYFNSMYIDCINNKNINQNNQNNQNNQCDFIKEKIHSLTQTQKLDNSKLRHHILYAVAK